MSEYDERYESLSRSYRKLEQLNEELTSENIKLRDELSLSNYKIEHELKPRIESERNSYDSYVTNGGSSDCFKQGMSGKCGIEYSNYGKEDNCFDGVSDNELFRNWQEGYGKDDIEDELENRESYILLITIKQVQLEKIQLKNSSLIKEKKKIKESLKDYKKLLKNKS